MEQNDIIALTSLNQNIFPDENPSQYAEEHNSGQNDHGQNEVQPTISPITKKDLMHDVQSVQIIPFHPDVEWMNLWEIEPNKFLKHFLPLALWSALKVTCISEAIRYPPGAQKQLEKVRQRFRCPSCPKREGLYPDKKTQALRTNKTWTAGSSTCWIDYEIKWKTGEKKKVVVRFVPTIYGEKCPRCRQDFQKGCLQNKVLVGIINRFIEGIAERIDRRIRKLIDVPQSVEVDFTSSQSPSKEERWFGKDIPIDSLYIRASENPLRQMSYEDDNEEVCDYFYEKEKQKREHENLKMNWWDVGHFESLFRQNSDHQAKVKEQKGSLIKVEGDHPHDPLRCEACHYHKCIVENKIKSDDFKSCLIDVDEQGPKNVATPEENDHLAKLMRILDQAEKDRIQSLNRPREQEQVDQVDQAINVQPANRVSTSVDVLQIDEPILVGISVSLEHHNSTASQSRQQPPNQSPLTRQMSQDEMFERSRELLEEARRKVAADKLEKQARKQAAKDRRLGKATQPAIVQVIPNLIQQEPTNPNDLTFEVPQQVSFMELSSNFDSSQLNEAPLREPNEIEDSDFRQDPYVDQYTEDPEEVPPPLNPPASGLEQVLAQLNEEEENTLRSTQRK